MTPEEFTTLYSRFRNSWVKVAHELMPPARRDWEDAEDAVADVVVKILTDELDTLHMEEKPEPWVRQKIVWRIKQVYWAPNKNENIVRALSVPLHMLTYELRDTRNDFEYDETETPLEHAVQEAFNSLDVQEQDIVFCIVFSKMSMPKIGKTLGLTKSQVMYRYQKALQQLRLTLQSVGIGGRKSFDNMPSETTETVA